MATKEEIVRGIELLIQEGRRVSRDLSTEQWQSVVDLDGWKNQEVLAHVAGVGPLVAPMSTAFSSAPAGSNAMAAVDIDELNAGIVKARAGKSAAELADEIEAAYQQVIVFVRGAPDGLLSRRVTVGGYRDAPLSDILMRMVVLHGLAHVYSVYASIFNRR